MIEQLKHDINMKVLVVDDRKDIREFVRVILRQVGIQCDTAENGAQTFEMVEKNVYDLILLDIRLPDIDGYNVCIKLKQMPGMVDVPVLFLTALEKSEQIVKGLKVGAVDYITKPFDKNELLARVDVHLALRRTRLQLRQQVADNRALVHILCHDLSNPIASTVSLLELMTDEDENVEELIPMVKQYLDRGLELIDLVRQMAAIEENKIDVITEPAILKDCFEESSKMLENRFKEKNIAINLNIPDDIIVLVEKTSFISSVINNLMTNAAKFSFEGSHIDIRAGVMEGKTIVTIRDYGIGMPEELLKNIFSMNSKTSRVGTNKEKGTGFGMSLVKRFVESYGGNIHIKSWEKSTSENERGTEVSLNLPSQ